MGFEHYLLSLIRNTFGVPFGSTICPMSGLGHYGASRFSVGFKLLAAHTLAKETLINHIMHNHFGLISCAKTLLSPMG